MDLNSSFLQSATYENNILTITFKNGNTYNYGGVPQHIADTLFAADSPSRFYQQNIKGKFSTINHNNLHMADKVIKLRINVLAVIKEWMFKGEKGTYLDCTLLYNESQDSHGNNGVIVQDVPKDVYKADTSKKGPILGNGKVWEKQVNNESSPGGGNTPAPTAAYDDLPF